MSKTLPPKDTHGPVVKTGPTTGQNRSRNKNGRWHKKRSDADVPRKFHGLTPETGLPDDILSIFESDN